MPLPDTALEWIATAVALWAIAFAVLWGLCVAAAKGDAELRSETDRQRPGPFAGSPVDVLEAACTALGVPAMTLFAGGRGTPLQPIAGQGSEHREIAARALEWSTVVTSGGEEDGPWLLATPVHREGAVIGVLAVTVEGRARGMAAATRRDLTRLATLAAAALPEGVAAGADVPSTATRSLAAETS